MLDWRLNVWLNVGLTMTLNVRLNLLISHHVASNGSRYIKFNTPFPPLLNANTSLSKRFWNSLPHINMNLSLPSLLLPP